MMISPPTLLPALSGSSRRTPRHIQRLRTHIPSSLTITFSSRCRFPNPKYRRNQVLSMSLPLSSTDPTTGSVGNEDLLIVGPGVLGRIIAEKWKQAHPNCHVSGQTMTTDHHDELINAGIIPSLRGTKDKQFPYVVFCAPPSLTEDYAADIRLAASNWNGEGSFIFTSSSGVFDCNDNGLCDEDSSIVPLGRSDRTDRILKAENMALESGGCVLRLAGLYQMERGAHYYWLKKGLVEQHPDHIINLIHHEDAASLAIAILKKKLRGRIFLGCDNLPLSRQEIMDYVNKSGKFSMKFQSFTGTSGPLGKRLNNSKTRAEIGWEPKYPSFPQFLGLQLE